MIYKLPTNAFKALAGHLDHRVYLSGYGKNGKPPWDCVALECDYCGCVIADWSPTSRKNKRKKGSPANF